VKQDTQDSGEQDTVQHMIDSFDKLTAMYFDGDQKELAAALVTKLRG
jgi:hypothetical protein